jgi:cbb3-type cytochrome oxidase maturation protein
MIVLLLLVPLSIGLAVFFLGAFVWAIRSGQYEDTDTPSMRVLLEEPTPRAVESAVPDKNCGNYDKKRVGGTRHFHDE